MNDLIEPLRYEQIVTCLRKIEIEQNVRVLYACESGSRAWGFASPDSDYDVRFIYVRPEEWYLSVDIEHKRDVIDLPIDDLLDVGGWDLRKSLKLMAKSNSPLLEWLDSPIVYIDTPNLISGFRKLAGAFFSPIVCGHHYLSMAKKNAEAIFQSADVRLKKYFYAIRTLFAARWIDVRKQAAPIQFRTLLESDFVGAEIRSIVEDLLNAKSNAGEKETIPAIEFLNQFIAEEVESLSDVNFAIPSSKPNFEGLSSFFRSWVKHGRAA